MRLPKHSLIISATRIKMLNSQERTKKGNGKENVGHNSNLTQNKIPCCTVNSGLFSCFESNRIKTGLKQVLNKVTYIKVETRLKQG